MPKIGSDCPCNHKNPCSLLSKLVDVSTEPIPLWLVVVLTVIYAVSFYLYWKDNQEEPTAKEDASPGEGSSAPAEDAAPAEEAPAEEAPAE